MENREAISQNGSPTLCLIVMLTFYNAVLWTKQEDPFLSSSSPGHVPLCLTSFIWEAVKCLSCLTHKPQKENLFTMTDALVKLVWLRS
jgi:hypothetical protein